MPRPPISPSRARHNRPGCRPHCPRPIAALRAGGAPDAIAYQADVREYARAQTVVADLLERFGRVDATVNNAGITSPKPFQALSDGPLGQQAIASIPAGRVGLPEDIANAVSFLVSQKPSYISGEALDVNGAVYID